MDILNMESSLGDKILCENDSQITVCINNTCTMFNKMTKEDIAKHRQEYYKRYLPKKIKETIENKMFSILKNPLNVNVYKEPEEYDADLEKLASQINEYNRDSILARMLCEFKNYASEYYIYDDKLCMDGILMKECYNFITNHMKYEITREDFEEDEYDIYDFMSNDE
jgi:hypothetical protein